MSEEIGFANGLTIKEAGKNEKWLQEKIFENPACLGLGELKPIERERRQVPGGILDILLKDSNDKWYEVEVQLGKTNPDHIIRTIEYWNYEKRRHPQVSHIAVLVAEKINNRFFNVVHLLGHYMPIIAIQVKVVEVNGIPALLFNKILDTSEEIIDEEEEEVSNSIKFTPTPEYWEAKSKCSLELAIYMKDLLSGVAKEPKISYDEKWAIIIHDFSDKKALGTDDQWDYFQISGYRNKVRVKFWTAEFEEMKKLLDEIDVQPSNVKELSDDWKEIHIIIDKNLVEQHRDVFIKIAEIQEKERIMLSEKN